MIEFASRYLIHSWQKNMHSYQEISNQDEMEGLLNSIAHFHDSLTKEIHMINRGTVLGDHVMRMSHQFDAQVLVQSQWPPFAIELLFIDVLELAINDAADYFGATGRVETQSDYDLTARVEMKLDTSFKISARQLFYRIQPEYLGVKARLNSEIPSPKAIPARLIDGQWRQCSSCCNAWEEDPSQIYSVCPKCLELTEIAA